MSDSISQAADALVAEVERVMQADLAALEQRESRVPRTLRPTRQLT
jgi:hypothetical protein